MFLNVFIFAISAHGNYGYGAVTFRKQTAKVREESLLQILFYFIFLRKKPT